MEEDYTDTHICLACQTTIFGLENYVVHRRTNCPARKSLHTSGKSGPPVVMSTTNAAHNIMSPSSYVPSDNMQGTLSHFIQPNSNRLSCSQPGEAALMVQSTIADTDHLDVSSVGSYLPSCSRQSNQPLLQTSTYLQPSSQVAPSLIGGQSNDRNLAVGTNRGQLSSSLGYSRSGQLSTSTQHDLLRTPQQGDGDLKLSPFRSAVGHLDLQLTPPTPHFDPGLSPLQLHDNRSHAIGAPQVSSHSRSESLNMEVSDAVASLVSTLSPSSTRGVDPNIVLYDTLPSERDTINDFFSSLELQSRGGADQGRGDTGDAEKNEPSLDHKEGLGLINKLDVDRLDHQKALRIASILDDLAFSSDSDNLLPSDTENLLDSCDDDISQPPRSHTGGKWRPGEQGAHSHGKLKLVGKKAPSSSPGKLAHGGKRLLGQTTGKITQAGKDRAEQSGGKRVVPHQLSGKYGVGLGKGSKGGKWQAGKYPGDEEEDDDDKRGVSDDGEDADDDDEDYEPPGHSTGSKGKRISGGKRFSYGKHIAASQHDAKQESGRVYSYGKQIRMDPNTSEGGEKNYYCKFCDRTLLNKVSYERHCSTNLHIKRSKGVPEEPVKEEVEEFECTVCEKKVNNRYNFARHLVSASHQKKAVKGERAFLLDESYQLLLSRQSRFQCHVCHFYCHKAEQLQAHLTSDDHTELAEGLLGPLLCVRCKFACYENSEILSHIESEQHQAIVTKSDRPCVIRESRFRVRCRQCSNTFHSATILKKHLETIHSGKEKCRRRSRKGQAQKRPICQYCKKDWPSFFAMEIHIRRKHTKERPFKCAECDCSYADKYSLTLHYRSKRHLNQAVKLGDMRPPPMRKVRVQKRPSKQKVSHKCKECNFTAEKYSDLRPHFLEAHAESVLECVTCGVRFVSLYTQTSHMASKGHAASVEDAKNSTVTHTCPTCDKKFYNTKKFTLHTLLHQHLGIKKMEKNCYKTAGVSEKHREFVESIKGVPASVRVTCPVCQQSLTRSQIYTHLRIHDGVSPFCCIYCQRAFSCPISLRRHLSRHIGIKLLNCKICKKKFSAERYLRIHILNAHGVSNDECKHKCPVCDKGFRLPWQLKCHQLLHSKPVRCSYPGCSLAFKAPSELLIHTRVHTGERPYLCDECGYTAATRHQLTRHSRSHTGERRYQCEYCSYRALNGTNLRRHMRIHTGTKPYKCPYCSYQCNSHENLRKHVLRTKKHAGKPVYACTLCNNYGTNSATDFKQHLIAEHKITEKDIDVLSAYAGIYNKSGDIRDVPEGSCAIPKKERKAPTSKKGIKISADFWKQSAGDATNDFMEDTSNKDTRIQEYAPKSNKRRIGVGQRLNNSDVGDMGSSDEEETFVIGDQGAELEKNNLTSLAKTDEVEHREGLVEGLPGTVGIELRPNGNMKYEPLDLTSNLPGDNCEQHDTSSE